MQFSLIASEKEAGERANRTEQKTKIRLKNTFVHFVYYKRHNFVY